MKIKVTILEHENKTGQSGTDYTRFKLEYTDGTTKWMSDFDEDRIKKLKEHKGKFVELEVEEVENKDPKKANYWNIRDFHGLVDDDSEDEPEDKAEKPKNGLVTMYTSYAKDIFNRIYDENVSAKDTMKLAVELVEQARDDLS